MKIKFLRDVELEVTLPPEKAYLTYGCPVPTDFEAGQEEAVQAVASDLGGMSGITFADGRWAPVCDDDFEIVEPREKT